MTLLTTDYYEFKDEKSSKFWEIEVADKTVTVRYGKIGTEGQTNVKTFASPSEASAHAGKVTAEKIKKGYTKTKRAVASKAKTSGAKEKASSKQAKHVTSHAKSNKRAAHGPAPTSQSELVAWLKEPGRSGPELATAVGRFAQTDRLIAGHDQAPPKLLAKLSHSKDRSTRARVASNPNAPAEDYVRLGQQFPSEFLANPLLDLLLLEDPAWAINLPEALLVQILKREGCPAGFLVWASAQPSEKAQLAVAMNASAPEAALAQLARSKHKKVRDSVAGGPVDDPEAQFREAVRERLARLTLDEAVDAWQRHDIGLAQFAQLSHDAKIAVAGLIDRYSHAVCQTLASNPATPEEVLDELARDVRSEVRLAVAKNYAAPRRILLRLQRDSNASIHWAARKSRSFLKPTAKKGRGPALAKLRDHTREALEAQIKHPDAQVRIELAKDPETPTDILEALVRHEFAEQERRLEMLEKPRDLEWFRALVSEAPVDVRDAVERDDYLHYCGKDPNKAVLSRRPTAMVLALASGPFVTPDRIAKVAGASDWLVRAAVARNPGTPPGLQEKLKRDAHSLVRALAITGRPPATTPKTATPSAGYDAKRVSSELSKLLSGRPGRDLRQSLIWSEECPRSLLEFFASDADASHRKSVAGHDGTPTEILNTLATDKVAEIREAVAGRAQTPAAILAILVKDRSENVRRRVAERLDVPKTELAVLAKDAKADVRVVVAGKSDISEELLRQLAEDVDASVRRKIAERPAMADEVLERLAGDKDAAVRGAVAGNPLVSETLLKKLANDNDAWVRRSVAGSRTVTEALLGKLSSDKDGGVREAVAQNPRTPRAGLELLAERPDDVRLALASNPAAPPLVLAALAKEPGSFAWARLAIVKNPSCPQALRETLWEALASDPNRQVRAGLLEVCDIPESVLETLSKDYEWRVLEKVAAHEKVSPTLLEALAKDSSVLVRSVVASHPKTPPAARTALLRVLSSAGSAFLRKEAAKNVQTPGECLERLAADKDASVRSSVARNPAAPPNALEVLASDTDEDVREALTKNPSAPRRLLESIAKQSADPWSRLKLAANSETAGLLGIEEMPTLPESSIIRWLEWLVNFPKNPDNKALTKASRDKNWLSRLGVALHPSATDAMLELLASDVDADVAAAARQKLALRRNGS